MSKPKKQPIENASEIIEKFGGIRPMSSKINVAVTTIQGWKKRGVIPAARKDLIINAANDHNIDISGFVGGVIPKEVLGDNSKSLVDVEEDAIESNTTENQANESNAAPVKVDEFASKDMEKVEPAYKDYTEVAVEIQNRAVKRSVIVVGGILLLIVAAAIGILKPKYDRLEKREARISELEGRLSALKQEQSTFKGLVPENWSEELEQLKRQAAKAGQSVSNTVESVKAISHDLATESGLNERVTQLQTYVSEISGENGIYALKGRFDEMRNSFMGKKDLDNSVDALLPIFSSSETENKDESRVNALIASARDKNESLKKSLSNVPNNELKAAATLLAMTQVRWALNRGDEDFDGDLQLLKNMVGKDNVKLYNSIEKLAPHARSGILTPGGLRMEFQTVAGDAVAASLRGEDVSVGEKFSAKFNEILKVEKDDELITGTETQATLNEAEKLIDNDSWQDALNLLRRELRAPELEPIRPWIKEVEKLISSRKLDNLIEEAMEMNFGSDLLGGSKTLKSGAYKIK